MVQNSNPVPKPHTLPGHTHGYDYSQSHMMKMYQANILISVNHKSNVEILKNRYGPHGSDIPISETINIFTEILTRQIFGDYLDMFRESLKGQLIKSINKTIKVGVYK